MTVEWMWTGVPTHNTIRIKARVTGAGTSRLLLSGTESRTNPTYTTPVTPVTVGSVKIADFTLTGLTEGRRYFAYVEDSGVLDTSMFSQFKTFDAAPGNPLSYRIGAWTCAGSTPDYPGATSYTSNHKSLEILTEEFAPDFTVIGGDIHYLNNSTASVTPYRTAYEAVLAKVDSGRMSYSLRNTPTSYSWDDHDFGPNDADSTTPGKPYVAQAYREYVPHETLVESGAIYRSQQIGRVLHVYMDSRYYRSPNESIDDDTKTLLGATQIAWFENLLATTTAEMLAWYMPTQWLGVGNDTWSSFTLERNRLVEILKAPAGDPDKDWTSRMFMVTGDVHAIAIDDGTGNPWGEFPCYVMASIDSAGSNNETNRYKVKGAFVPASAGRGRFGIIDIDDDGDRIKVDAKCYIGRWKRFQHEWELRTSPAAIVGTVTYSDVEAFTEIDWRAGTYFGQEMDIPEGPQQQTITEWHINRQLATDIPDAMRLSAGLSTAQADTVVAAPSGATLGHWSPWKNPGQYLQAPLKMSVVADGEEYPQFTGTTQSAGSGGQGVALQVSALDSMLELDQPITMPAFGGEMAAGFNPGISPAWVVEHALMQFDRGALWAPGPNVLFYASMAGSTMTNIGLWANSTSSQDANSAPTFIETTDLPYPVPQAYGSRLRTGITDDFALTSSTGWTFGAITGDAPLTTYGEFNADIWIPSIGAGRYLTVKSVSDTHGHKLVIQSKLDTGVTITSHEEIIQHGAWWVTAAPASFGYNIQVHQEGWETYSVYYLSMSTATSTVGVEHKLGLCDVYGYDSAVLGFQLLEGSAYTDVTLPKYDPSKARISLPTTTLVGTPILDNPTGKSVLQGLADAEQGAAWFDEDGLAVFESRADLRGVGKERIPVHSDVSLVSAGSWTTSLDQLRSRVDVPVSIPAITLNTLGWQQVWDATSIVEVRPYETLDVIVTLDIPAGGLATTLWAGSATGGSWFTANRKRNGSGSQIVASSKNSGEVSAVTSTQARVRWTNPYSYTLYFVDTAGKPNFHIGARWAVTPGDELTSSRDTGQSGTVLAVGQNPWRQDLNDAGQLAQYLADETKAPRPYLNDLEVTFDPRIRLASVIKITDPDYLGAEITCLVRGVDLVSHAGVVTQKLSVQPLRLTLGEVDLAWHGSTLQDIDDAWRQFLTFSSVVVEPNTLQAFDNDPLKGAPNADN